MPSRVCKAIVRAEINAYGYNKRYEWVANSSARESGDNDWPEYRYPEVGSNNDNPNTNLMVTDKLNESTIKVNLAEKTVAHDAARANKKPKAGNSVECGTKPGSRAEQLDLGASDDDWEVCNCEALAKEAQDEQDRVEWVLVGKTEAEKACAAKR
ncbi:hypothetical protein IAQ61_005386 [Plenodomus lingam]|uniref:Predicted protein n=1 Tax=Leptosphaeria maculans (strain JN3 / isolate v23.1.3 / race Av1-4-5-6-7-8) TaxID=985895 RepID=E4ZZF6_LEPMJ|nr:predicted protein [Plenodomus lingam JN3]KAH9871207.1 hypothetical protein IAQ61_005386 [Plenodomus lingam]CBX96751.1 predicted protein [Plenodomus lingam JN3]